MDKIDLDAIYKEVAHRKKYDTLIELTKDCMKEAIHQSLVLASKKARARTHSESNDHESWTVTSVDKQSILDVEKLIV